MRRAAARLGERPPARRRRRPPARATPLVAPRLVAASAEAACLLEAQAPKPGNVARGRDLPGLTWRDFVLSAAALEGAFHRNPRARVGRLVFEAVRATRGIVSTNTNLGIVLLLAPLARAATRPGRGSLRVRLAGVLDDLDVADAHAAYRAIRLARPGGLGRVARQDVRRAPTESLLECMRLAAARDAVAREYATRYDATWRVGLPAFRRARAAGLPIDRAVVATGLALMAEFPDTLIVRRHGAAAARAVRREARAVLAAGGPATPRGRALVERLDRWLRDPRRRFNPGATADLVTASLFVWLLERASRRRPATKRRDAGARGT